MKPDPVFKIEVQPDGYAILYDLRQPEGKQIEIIGPLSEVMNRQVHLLYRDGFPVV